MNKTLTNLFIFATGAAIGSVVTWKFVKEKYERLAQEEIEVIREYYAKLTKNAGDTEHSEPTEQNIPDIQEKPAEVPKFTEQDRVDYANLASTYTTEKGGPVTVQMPEIITPGEFSEGIYPTVTLNYYTDGVLVDEYGDVVDPADVESMIGSDFASHFGEYEDDSVFVRNERLETDYEILRNDEAWSDVPKTYTTQGYE